MKNFIFRIILIANLAGYFAIEPAFTQSVLTIGEENSIVLNGAYITMNGGTSTTHLFLVVNQPYTTGIVRNSGHIISENQYNYVKWMAGTATGNFVYPFGYSTTDYLPVTLNKTTAGSASIDASTWGTDNKNQPHAGPSDGGTLGATFRMRGVGDSISSVIDRWWDFYPSGPLTANLILSYRGAENATTVNTTDNLDMQHWNGSSWDKPIAGTTTGVVSGVGTLSVSGVTAFSPMVIIHRTGSLPVTIAEFNMECTQTGVAIYWITTTELNSDYFDLERSSDGLNFQPIAHLKAAGNSTVPLHYKFTDDNKFSSGAYYRLKEVDFDGTTDFSNVIHSACAPSLTGAVRIYPNPVYDLINYQINAKPQGVVSIEILDQAGQAIIREQYIANSDSGIPPTDVSFLNEGFYFVKLRHEQNMFLLKFIKLKK